MSGSLYIVATPIGNLEDITLRAISILSEVDIILAEDTRVTGKLLAYLNSKFPASPTRLAAKSAGGKILNAKLVSYHQHTSEEKKFEILKNLLDGQNIALVSDAGTPGISDPGNELIDFILKSAPEVKISPIPGASAITTALSVCGFRADKFVFLGFLPKKKRARLFDWLKAGDFTFAFYESPKRIFKTLTILADYFGENTRVFIARELTKIYETLYRGSIGEVKEALTKDTVKGELVVVVEV